MFNLTQQERTVLLFIASVILVGSLLQIVSKQYPFVRHFLEFTEHSQVVKIDINTADLQTLQKISYVGEATARAIIDARQKRGHFKTVEDLISVHGIGPRRFTLIQPFLKVSP